MSTEDGVEEVDVLPEEEEEEDDASTDDDIFEAVEDSTDDEQQTMEDKHTTESDDNPHDGEDVEDSHTADSHDHASGESDDVFHDGDELSPMASDQIALGDPTAKLNGSLSHHRGNARMSLVRDMSTGKLGGVRGHQAVLRAESSMRPTTAFERRKHDFLKGLKEVFTQEVNEDEADDAPVSMHGRLKVTSNQGLDDVESGQPDVNRQYHLEALHPHAQARNRVESWLGVGRGLTEERSGKGGWLFGTTPNQLVMNYLRWSVRSSFVAVFLSGALAFLFLTLNFALILWALEMVRPNCIGGVEPDTHHFMDAFALSWTTFSTVGYGLVYSGTSADKRDVLECTGITIIVALEAFIGVLFGSFCSAVVFGKISRIQSFAQVAFSDPIVIRFGTGVSVENSRDEKDLEGGLSESFRGGIRGIPCPVLEFRVVNRLNGTLGGEILDASVNIVASIDAKQANRLNQNAGRRRRGKKGKKKGPMKQAAYTRQRSLDFGKDKESDSEIEEADKPAADVAAPSLTFRGAFYAMKSNANKAIPLAEPSSSDRQAIEEEDPTGHIFHKRIFSKLEVESPEHPFFKRVWIIRHRLDADSPILKPHMRHLVKLNGGYWPQELNSAAGVRSAVLFDQIIVSLSGTSNADANSVYAQKVYEFVDINVGYRFVNLLYRDPVDEGLLADIRLINDVVEQAGGGGEAFSSIERNFGGSMRNMLVL